MILKADIAQHTASLLLQIKAIKLNIKNPFLWASGWKSPIYCDNRIVLSYPKIRNYLAQSMADQIKMLYPETQVVAGVATGAIGMGMLVAEKLQLPFVYIRPEAKKHGRQNQIEGVISENQKVIVIEDLISTGMSSLKAVDAILSTNAKVLGLISIFSYGFDIAENNFKDARINLHSLCDYTTLIKNALQTNYITEEEFQSLAVWRENPEHWSLINH